MRLRLLAILTVTLFAALPARAQVQYPVSGPNPGTTAPGVVNMCPSNIGTYVPCGTFGALPLQWAIGLLPGANDVGNVGIKGYSFTNIASQTTTVIKAGPGVLHTICVNTPAATGTIQAYDNTAGSGTKIGLVTSFASVSGCFTYDAAFSTGLTIVTATASPDITVTWR